MIYRRKTQKSIISKIQVAKESTEISCLRNKNNSHSDYRTILAPESTQLKLALSFLAEENL